MNIYIFQEEAETTKPPATINLLMKQYITIPLYRNSKWKTNVLSKRKLVDGPTYRYLFVYIYLENDKNIAWGSESIYFEVVSHTYYKQFTEFVICVYKDTK